AVHTMGTRQESRWCRTHSLRGHNEHFRMLCTHTRRLDKVLHSVEGLVGEIVALVVVVLLHGLEEHVIDGRVEGRRVGRHLAVGVLAVQVVLGRRAQRQQEHVATELYRLHTKHSSVG
ncbi:MAG: hypothetical protein ACK56I_36775, partial [bacterium]